MINIILSLCLTILLFYSGYTQNSDAKYTGEFLNIPAGVKASGMGSAFVAVTNDGSAFFYNPAGTVLVKGQLITSQYTSLFGSVNDPLSSYIFSGYSQHFGGYGSVSVNWIRLSIDDIKKYDKLSGFNGELRKEQIADIIAGGSTFNNNQDAFYLNYAMEFKPTIDFGWMFFKVPYRVPLGINLKYIRQSFGGEINYTGTGFGADFGIMVINDVNDYFSSKIYGDLTFGIAIKDFTNTIVTWNSTDKKQFKISPSTVWGFSYRQPFTQWNVEATVSYQRTIQYDIYSSWGAEFVYDKAYALRLGTMDSQFTMGLGINIFSGINIDYGFQIHELGNPHRIGLSVNIESLKW